MAGHSEKHVPANDTRRDHPKKAFIQNDFSYPGWTSKGDDTSCGGTATRAATGRSSWRRCRPVQGINGLSPVVLGPCGPPLQRPGSRHPGFSPDFGVTPARRLRTFYSVLWEPAAKTMSASGII